MLRLTALLMGVMVFIGLVSQVVSPVPMAFGEMLIGVLLAPLVVAGGLLFCRWMEGE